MGVMARGKTQMAEFPRRCWPPVMAGALSEPEAGEWSKVFKALSEPRRLRLLSLIASAPGGEVCVCELTGEFGVTAPTISFHLRVLREAGLVDSERRGSWVYYWVNEAMLVNLVGFFAVPAVPVAS